jgi:type II secretory pathway pseudopilin PulG
MTAPLRLRSESGASQVAVMIAVALLGVTATLSSQALKHLNSAKRRVEVSKAAQDVESVLIQAVVQQYRSYVNTNRCATSGASFFSGIDLGQIGTASLSAPTFRDLDGNPGQAPALAQTAVQRCTGTPFVQAGTLTSNANTFYGCLNIQTSAAARALTDRSRDAFAANHGAFIETFVKIRNLQTDALTTCDNARPGQEFGIELYYAVHWITKDASQLNYNTKVGTLNVSL